MKSSSEFKNMFKKCFPKFRSNGDYWTKIKQILAKGRILAVIDNPCPTGQTQDLVSMFGALFEFKTSQTAPTTQEAYQ